ncbi:MAG: amidophosphoribosyltransferase [Myxococcota bacterium]|nr:amidophosphoribosyltransferase [Myxococcota bacterium]
MCGIVGIAGYGPVSLRIYDALTVLQHRGQDAAGIATADGSRLITRKDNGLVKDVFRSRHMNELSGTLGIGHVRYPTAGTSSQAEAQPFEVRLPAPIALGHNGNLTNTAELRVELQDEGVSLNTSSDSEILLHIFDRAFRASEHKDQLECIFDAVGTVHQKCHGAYAVVAVIPNIGLVAFRDPNGIRPMIYGTRRTDKGETEVMVSSESVALDVLDFEIIRDIDASEALIVTNNLEIITRKLNPQACVHPCLFELVYMARPDSVIDRISVYKSRLRMGDRLAHQILQDWPEHDIDVVIPIPDTSRSSAIQMAHHLNVKYREGFIKNRYIGRTFIMPGQELRKKSVRKKLNPIDLEFRDKNVLLVDDSIVRGTTCQQIIQMARDAGAKKVYLASAAPAVRYPNVYGIDMPSASELIAHNRSTEEICEELGADRLFYQDLKDLVLCAKDGNPKLEQFEDSVFSGNYVTGDVTRSYLNRLEAARNDVAKAAKNQPYETQLA